MTIHKLILELDSNIRKAKILYDFRSKHTQIHADNGESVWSGRVTDLGEDELHQEVIPSIQESE